MLYRLSKLIPVPMRSTYRLSGESDRMRATWWQWRGRVFRHQMTIL